MLSALRPFIVRKPSYLIAVGVLIVALLFAGCHEKTSNKVPVGFDVVGLKAEPDALYPYNMKVTGDIQERGKVLTNKVVLLQIAGTVSFRDGVSMQLYARDDRMLLTNGKGLLECWAMVGSTNEAKRLAAESSTARFDFRSDGYSELKPAEIKVR